MMNSESRRSDSKIVPIDPAQAELVRRVENAVRDDGVTHTALPGVAFIRGSEVVQPLPAVYSPSLCVVVQGRKRAIVADESFYYDPFNYLFVSVTLPMLGQVLDASPERPYLCVRIEVDMREVSSLLLDMAERGAPVERTGKPLYVGRMNAELVDVLLRFVRLLDAPEDIAVLGPLASREIWYRLLRSDMGPVLRRLIEHDGPIQRVSRAIEMLQKRYDQPLHVEDLAQAAHMSVSTFHAHFKSVTSMSPLQFQKRLRLHEARRLMMSEGFDGASAGHRVGYSSPSHFNREYRRLFGAPPHRDVVQWRAQQ